MMDKKQRYIAYGCGFLIGIVLVILFFGEKFQSKFQEKRISTAIHHLILGKDRRAKKPMPVELALAYKDYPAEKMNQYLRVLILNDGTQDRLLRIEETIMRDPIKRTEKLLLRRQMLGDKVLIRLKNPSTDNKELSTLLSSLQASVESAGRRKGLYYLKVKGNVENPDHLFLIMNQLNLDEMVDAAMPVYINEE